ncbi:Pr6Pr family membrane protein [Myxacorys almedinensis]|uniref:Integral membrane protein n=1 Tax=Myxacorys almedinensis A TaxID=2690445 RepID=A0A8J8CMN8_9CYAN|nr:Pr6Pr family membrane protein [Myxacorys almedinensis]NDJ18875.1 hypothetical protein [Myxacorys almedinensis A]
MTIHDRSITEKATAFSRSYAAIVGTIGWLVLGLQLYLTTTLAIKNGLTLWVGIARYFGFFTVLTNILVALVLTLPLLRPRSRWAQFCVQPSVRTATAVYIVIVGAAYFLLLRQLWNPEGWQLLADRGLHYFIPIAYVGFWVAFVPKAALRSRDLLGWLIYPLVYSIVALSRGAIFNWYPYPFLDAAKLGYPQVLVNVALLFVAFCVVGLLLIAIGRLLSRAVRKGTHAG